jgi:acetyltransferase-like isoleucine patch superfamily enzyme
MKEAVSRLLSKVKGERWEFDKRIPNSYLVSFLLAKIAMLIRGQLRFHIFKRLVLVGPHSKIYCRSKIKINGTIDIERNCLINALSANGISFGRNVSIGKYTTIECSGSLKNIGVGLIVGNNVGLGTHGFYGCAGGVTIGNDVICGNYVSLHSENHIIENSEVPIRLQGVTRQGIIIGNNCWIGAKATILDGVSIGDGCVIAAGAVVTKGKYEANSIIGGVPARIIGHRS